MLRDYYYKYILVYSSYDIFQELRDFALIFGGCDPYFIRKII